jgi:excinuclease ABC subunit B
LPHGFLTIIDESHVTVSQIRAMYNGDKARKDTLVDHGFRLPSARDNRPLTYAEFDKRIGQVVYVSATPTEYETGVSGQVVEQIVRPTGLVDPEIIVRPIVGRSKDSPPFQGGARGGLPSTATPPNLHLERGGSELSQIEDLIIRIEERIAQNERVLVTTLTKKMAEDLTDYLKEKKIKVAYLHSDVSTLDRIEVIMNLRLGNNDVIVGVNLLREGLDMPEVSLVAILDADKEGFLRSETSLIQTIGRAARNVNGQVVLYADTITGSMERAMAETKRRRDVQIAYNVEHGITPKTIQKTIRNILEEFGISSDKSKNKASRAKHNKQMTTTELDLLGDDRSLDAIVKDKEVQMKTAAQQLDFELAAILRDEIRELRAREKTTEVKELKKKNRKTIPLPDEQAK